MQRNGLDLVERAIPQEECLHVSFGCLILIIEQLKLRVSLKFRVLLHIYTTKILLFRWSS
jgi:hypothetical protein